MPLALLNQWHFDLQPYFRGKSEKLNILNVDCGTGSFEIILGQQLYAAFSLAYYLQFA